MANGREGIDKVATASIELTARYAQFASNLLIIPGSNLTVADGILRCFRYFGGQGIRLQTETLLMEGAAATVNIERKLPSSIAWNLVGHSRYHPHKVDDDEITIPIIQKSYRLQIALDDLPSGSRNHGQEADCTVRALIDKNGIATDLTVSQSTGFASLDQTCVKAIQQAPFTPARQDGKTISATPLSI